MKSLKFDHKLAEPIRSGKKTATWRIYDDKDIHVDDVVELLDKVNPKDPTSLVSIGTARVNMVVEKRLGDLTDIDYQGHEHFTSINDMLETYRHYYGSQISLETPIKMIHFVLISHADEERPLKSIFAKELKVYADGGSRGNPGPSAAGYVLIDMNDVVLTKAGVYLGITTNNQAEYQALKFALEEARRFAVQDVHVFMDSLLVVNQMLGTFKVKNRDLWPIHDSIENLCKQFHHVSFTHVPRELNKIADLAVNEALDAAEKANKGKH